MKATNIKNLFVLLVILFSCSVLGQVVLKKHLTEADYQLWSTIEMKEVSAKGGWVSYHLAYESKNDTLFVRNKTATKTYSFPKGYEGRFANDSWFKCMLPDKVFTIVNLKNGSTRVIKNVKQSAFSSDGLTLITLSDLNQLSIGPINGSVVNKIEDVAEFSLNPSGTALVYTIDKEISSLNYCLFDGGKVQVQSLASDAEASFNNIIWQGEGNAFAFVKSYKDSLDVRNTKNLYLYRFKDSKLYGFDANTVSDFAKGSSILPPLWTRFIISEDGKRVFFFISETAKSNAEKPIVQVWNGNDSWTYSQVQKEGRLDIAPKCAVWFPDSGQFRLLTTTSQPKIMLSGDQQYAITYNPTVQKPQFDFHNKIDWYVTNLNTGKQTLFLQDKSCIMGDVTSSYGGKFITYRSDSHWWVYELATGRHINVSAGIFQKIYDVSNDRAGHHAYGIAGWTADDSCILIYDEYDLWSVNLKNLKTERLTKGREQQIVFRLAKALGQNDRLMNFDGFIFPKINLEAGIYLKADGKITRQSGYYRWKGVEDPLVFADKSITEFGFSKDCETLYYKVEDYNTAPAIMTISKRSATPTMVFNSNPQQVAYHWGNSKLISYTNSKNKQLQGALYYPADYDSSKKYPMVVYIYEKLSQHLHNYVNPSLYNGGGANISNLTAQGYFVLYPDISYEMGHVGSSATDCVVSATKAVIQMGLVHADKIALTGHSFGGYEVSYIATQTPIFATIIVGAGVTDLISSYFSIGWNNGRPEIWRYEYDMWRMGKSFYEDMDGYLRNSPIMHAQKISAPILIWTGELDLQVHYHQSIAFYNALRRLGKKEIMLIYPENRHVLTQGRGQIDFTHKYEQWLATFLKDAQPSEWIKKGIE
ncbi:alpha/beta hydrolase family protein [Flavobacterium sp. TMP13]|uniref:alpha/beta hydrolase family protein n=1 Tax=Flavobacterium sp. TMP13 TaxID=3425950 RepID=UPI003D784206